MYAYCKGCGQKFKQRKSNHLYCEDNCRKLRWLRENRWKRKDICPSCGGIKTIGARFCKPCAPPNNPTGINGR